MVSKFLIAALAFVALAAANRADAADLSLAPLYKAPPIAPAYDWSGFYLGANGGGGWGRSHWDTAGRINTSGGLAGGTAGYNWQLGKAVLGVEGDLDWSGLKGTKTSTLCPFGCTTSDSWLSTVRGRAGYSFDRIMPYVTGGLAVGDIKAARPACPAAVRPMPAGRSAAASNSPWPATGPPRPSTCTSISADSIAAPTAAARRPTMSHPAPISSARA